MEKYTLEEQNILHHIRAKQRHQFESDLSQWHLKLADWALSCTYMFLAKGTAFAISPDGLLVTCSHCVREGKNLRVANLQGEVFEPKVLQWDEKLDLSLLKIEPKRKIPFFALAKELQVKGSQIFCIGNPDPYDRTVTDKKIPTGFLPFHLSYGRVLGYQGDSIHRVNKLGPMIHGCWTYWGHSGGPIFNTRGELSGVHNSWDSKTGYRRGMTVKSVQRILQIGIQKEVKIGKAKQPKVERAKVLKGQDRKGVKSRQKINN